MDTFIDGKKGSGKTYYAVNMISKLEDRSKILHNIKGLKLGLHINDLAKKWQLQPIDFFRDSLHDPESPNHDERFKKLHGFKFIVDECHKLFPRKLNNEDVKEFFSMCRHYEIDNYLITQFPKRANPEIIEHCELHYHALPETTNPIPGFLCYQQMSGGEKVGIPISIKKKKELFALYDSFDTETQGSKRTKTKRPMFVLLCISGLIAIGTIGYLFHYLTSRSDRYEHTNQLSNSASNQAPGSPALSQHSRIQEKTLQDPNKTKYEEGIKQLANDFGGIQVSVSKIEDGRGTTIFFLGNIYARSQFPYKLIETPFGLKAIVPVNVYQYYQSEMEKTKMLAQYDPNTKYLWSGDTSIQSNQSQSIVSTRTWPEDEDGGTRTSGRRP